MRRVAVYMGTRNYYGMMVTAAKSLLRHTRMDRVWRSRLFAAMIIWPYTFRVPA